MADREELELLERLRGLYEEYERLNRRIQLATHRQHFSNDSKEIKKAVVDERKWLVEINRLMDRMRATEGALLKARGQVKPLVQ
jgi:hypothetical protein